MIDKRVSISTLSHFRPLFQVNVCIFSEFGINLESSTCHSVFYPFSLGAEDEASVEKESSELGEGAGRLSQGVRELRGDVCVGRNRWAVHLESDITTISWRSNALRASFSSTVSLMAFSAMAVLAVLEFFVYRDTWMKYEYEVDKDFSRWAITKKLLIYINMAFNIISQAFFSLLQQIKNKRRLHSCDEMPAWVSRC